MKIIIAGVGDVGTHLAKLLSEEDHDIVVIDPDPDMLKQVESHIDLLAIEGSSTYINILKEANVKNADLVITVTNSQSVNTLTAILAKNLGAKKTIVRIHHSEYQDQKDRGAFKDLGIDHMIYPEELAASEITGLLKETEATDVFEFSGGKLVMLVLKLEENTPIINMTLRQIALENPHLNFRAVAIHRDSQTIIPTGIEKFLAGDLVCVLTHPKGIKKIKDYIGKRKKMKMQNIMILGGSRIGIKTAKKLEGHGNVKLIEMNKEKSFELADKLKNTLVINGDGRNVELITEEGIENMDAFIAVTGNSETNILSCVLAKKYGVKKTIALIENIDYIDIAQKMGVDTLINKKMIAASHIFQYTMKAEVKELKYLHGINAEVLEFVAKPGSKVTKVPIRELEVPEGATIGGIVRGNEGFIAMGSTKIEANDKVVVFSLPDAVHKIEQYFN